MLRGVSAAPVAKVRTAAEGCCARGRDREGAWVGRTFNFDKLPRSCSRNCDNGTTLQELREEVIEEVLHHLRTATDTAPGWAKSWHHWGLFNLALLGHHAAARDAAKAQSHVAPAVVGFFRSVALGQSDGALNFRKPGYRTHLPSARCDAKVRVHVAPPVVGFSRLVELGQPDRCSHSLSRSSAGCWLQPTQGPLDSL